MLYIEITLIITFIMVVGMMAAIGIKGLNDDIAEGEKWAEFFENNPFPIKGNFVIMSDDDYLKTYSQDEIRVLPASKCAPRKTARNNDIMDLFTDEEIKSIVRKDS